MPAAHLPLDQRRDFVGPLTVWSVLVPPLVTALRVRIVQRLGEGAAPTAWRAMREAAAAVPVAVLAMALYSLSLITLFTTLLYFDLRHRRATG